MLREQVTPGSSRRPPTPVTGGSETPHPQAEPALLSPHGSRGASRPGSAHGGAGEPEGRPPGTCPAARPGPRPPSPPAGVGRVWPSRGRDTHTAHRTAPSRCPLKLPVGQLGGGWQRPAPLLTRPRHPSPPPARWERRGPCPLIHRRCPGQVAAGTGSRRSSGRGAAGSAPGRAGPPRPHPIVEAISAVSALASALSAPRWGKGREGGGAREASGPRRSFRDGGRRCRSPGAAGAGERPSRGPAGREVSASRLPAPPRPGREHGPPGRQAGVGGDGTRSGPGGEGRRFTGVVAAAGGWASGRR